MLVWLCHKSYAADQGQSLIDLADQITLLNSLMTPLAEWLDVGQIAQRKFESNMISKHDKLAVHYRFHALIQLQPEPCEGLTARMYST